MIEFELYNFDSKVFLLKKKGWAGSLAKGGKKFEILVENYNVVCSVLIYC